MTTKGSQARGSEKPSTSRRIREIERPAPLCPECEAVMLRRGKEWRCPANGCDGRLAA